MNENKIWKYLYSKLNNPYGAAGLMGNLFVESSLNPKNLQGTYERKLGMTDDQYTIAVDNGSYTNFTHDSAGYGLAQWTYSTRKEALLNYSKEKGKSVGDLDLQLEFLWKELQSYKTCLRILIEATTVKEASDAVVVYYERPKNQSEEGKQNRANYGQKYFDMFMEEQTDEDYPQGGGSHMEEPLYRAIVKADSGKTVRMRSRPSTSASILANVPLHTNVEVMDVLDGWSQIVYNGTAGYMMSKFLQPEDEQKAETKESTTQEQLREIQAELNEALNIVNRVIRKLNNMLS